MTDKNIYIPLPFWFSPPNPAEWLEDNHPVIADQFKQVKIHVDFPKLENQHYHSSDSDSSDKKRKSEQSDDLETNKKSRTESPTANAQLGLNIPPHSTTRLSISESVEIIMKQSDCSKEQAYNALVKHHYDIVDAIMSLID